MNKRYEFSYLTKQVLTILVYCIFFGFLIWNIVQAKDNSARIFNLLILILCGLPAVLYDFLRYNYDSATKKTVFECNPKAALKQIETVEKFDVLKMFQTSCMMLKMLCLMDLREFDELKKYVVDVEAKDTKDYDVTILSRYSEMIANGELGIKGKMNDAYKRMISLRDMKDKKGRRRKGAYFFNWDVVSGQHKYYSGEKDKAYRFVKDVKEDNMNKRESMHYFILRALCARNVKQEEYELFKERALKAAGKNEVMLDYIEHM